MVQQTPSHLIILFCLFQNFVRVECLKDLTEVTEIKASSRQSMIASLTGITLTIS